MSARSDLLRITAAFAALSAVYWLAVLGTVGSAGFPLDDAYIHLQFARNLVESGQMAFNAGAPSSGCTAPLYAFLLAGTYRLVGDWYVTSAVLGGLCTLASLALVYAIVRDWSQRRDAALWAALTAMAATPTVIAAYSGMETPAYVLAFLAGLWLYARPRTRLLATLCFAIGVWLRPEFVMLAGIIGVERIWAFFRQKDRRYLAAIGELAIHAAIWLAVLAAYAAYHWQQDRHLVPSTFAAKSIATLVFAPQWMGGLPAMLARGAPGGILLAIFVWPLMTWIGANLGLGVVCMPLIFGSREASLATLRDTSATAPGRRLAVLTLLLYPVIRGLIDPIWPFWFQYQRYYAHLTPLLIVIVFGAIPLTGNLLDWKRWSWRGVPLERQFRRAAAWALPFLIVRGAMAVMAVGNIHDMQVALGQWVRDNTPRDALIATNDIGAIAFISRRPILDTIGLVEPPIVEHYRAGGTLTSYLAERRPACLIAFPRWYPELEAQPQLYPPVQRVKLRLNVICGADEMVVYRPAWSP